MSSLLGAFDWYVLPQWVGFFRRFGVKTVIDFAYFGLNSGLVFVGIT